MKKHWLVSIGALLLLTANAFAAEEAPMAAPDTAKSGEHKEWTLEKARAYAHSYADKLDKMTPEQWAERQKKRHDRIEKWKAMTPEEKEAAKKRHQEWRAEKKAKTTDAKPAAGTDK